MSRVLLGDGTTYDTDPLGALLRKRKEPPMIPLTKTLDPDDYKRAEILKVLPIVDQYFDIKASEHRRWEYALALRAIWCWKQQRGEEDPKDVVDVGGHNSRFWQMVEAAGDHCTIIDPNRLDKSRNSVSVEKVAAVLNHPTYDVVCALSVFEHTTRPLAFLDACHQILRPGGLLFLTFDYAVNACGEDTYHFNWMRERIVDVQMWAQLQSTLEIFSGMTLFGERDSTDHGPQVYNYTFASLCLRKAP